MFGDDGVGSKNGSFPDPRVVEDNGADADEDRIRDGTAVNGGVMADGDHLSDEDGVEVTHSMEDGAVLDVGARADANGVDISPDDGIHPDAGLLAQRDVTMTCADGST